MWASVSVCVLFGVIETLRAIQQVHEQTPPSWLSFMGQNSYSNFGSDLYMKFGRIRVILQIFSRSQVKLYPVTLNSSFIHSGKHC